MILYPSDTLRLCPFTWYVDAFSRIPFKILRISLRIQVMPGLGGKHIASQRIFQINICGKCLEHSRKFRKRYRTDTLLHIEHTVMVCKYQYRYAEYIIIAIVDMIDHFLDPRYFRQRIDQDDRGSAISSSRKSPIPRYYTTTPSMQARDFNLLLSSIPEHT